MKRIIITGANGFLGSSLTKKMVDNNVEVVALDISFSKSRLPVSKLITPIEVGLESIEEIFRVIPQGEYDALYHFAWQGVNGPEKGDPSIQLKNCQMTLNCAKVASKLGCKKILCAGTISEQAVNSLPNLDKTSGGMIYGVAKHCAHLMLESSCKNIGLGFVWMQFSNIYGPNNKTGNLVSYTVGELLKGNEATFGPAMQPYDFIYVDDLLEAIYLLGERENVRDCYFIGSGEPRILKDYLLEIGRLYGREDLIKIGVRPDDGIVYSYDMFDTTLLKNDIGEYVTKSFTEGIQYTLKNY